MNNIIWMIFDSCRYDSFVKAKTPNINKLGKVEKRYSYASWTSPAHYVFLMGLVPHTSPKQVFANEVYKKEFLKWTERTGINNLSFKDFLPHINLPTKLRELGYRTIARVSLPVLNEYTSLNTGFDDYRLMEDHFNFKGMIEEMSFSNSQPAFYFLNIGETHYPYMLRDSELPYLSGIHGIIKDLENRNPKTEIPFFNKEKMKFLHNQQIKCVEYLDQLIGTLYEKCLENTYFIITSDHGELFGEAGYFGHGPITHPKVFEVPFVEGKLMENAESVEQSVRSEKKVKAISEKEKKRIADKLKSLGYM